MVGEDGIIRVQHKSDHSPVCIIELRCGYYQVPRLARHNEIYYAATDFCQQALVLSSTRLYRTATHIHADGTSLPKRASEFFPTACAEYYSEHYVPLPVSNPQSKNTLDQIH